AAERADGDRVARGPEADDEAVADVPGQALAPRLDIVVEGQVVQVRVPPAGAGLRDRDGGDGERGADRDDPQQGQDGQAPVQRRSGQGAPHRTSLPDLSMVRRYGYASRTITAVMSTAIAAAWPASGSVRKANACCHSSTASTMLSSPGPPPVIT